MTLRLTLLSDLHVDWTTSGVERFAEADRALRKATQDAVDRRVDAFVFLGDLMNPDGGSRVFRCLAAAMDAAANLAAEEIPSFWMTGNHDVIEDGSGGSSMLPIRHMHDELVHLQDGPSHFSFGDHILVFFPFAPSSHAYDAEAHARQVLTSSRDDVTIVAFSHLHLRGIQPGEETSNMQRGRDVFFPDEVFAEAERAGRKVRAFSGHYHRRQVHECPSGLRVQVVGAPLRFTHGEEDHVPGFLRVTLP